MKPFCVFWGLLCFRRLFSPSVPSELNHRSPSPFMEKGLEDEVSEGGRDKKKAQNQRF